MPSLDEIRAEYDRNTVTVYQACNSQIADAALKHQRFVSPFSFGRMTWIKPSFLWLMYRSHWGQKDNQERILAVRINREGWEKALSLCVLTHYEPTVYRSAADWESKFSSAPVHVQWDTERSLRGGGLNHYSIQVGISRSLIRENVEEWIVKIEDMTTSVAKMRSLMKSGNENHVRQLLPSERGFPIQQEIARRIQIR